MRAPRVWSTRTLSMERPTAVCDSVSDTFTAPSRKRDGAFSFCVVLRRAGDSAPYPVSARGPRRRDVRVTFISNRPEKMLFKQRALVHNGVMQRAVLVLLLAISSMAAEWKPLFNGRDLSGWTNVNCAPSTWSARDDMVVSTGIPTGVLRTWREYENFILEVEWKHLKPGGNAGLFVHSGALPVRGQPFTKAIEVQIIDRDHPEGLATSHGDVFSIQGATFTPDRPHPKGWMRCLPSERRARPAGEWNHYRVECRDGRVTLAVNGKVVSGGSNCVPRKGFICLESEGSECHFRNVRIQELPPSGAPVQVDEGFRSLYTGVDLSGWKQDAGHKGHWIPKDWILEYDGKSEAPDHSLWSEREYGDFVLIVDCRSPQKGEMQHVPVT